MRLKKSSRLFLAGLLLAVLVLGLALAPLATVADVLLPDQAANASRIDLDQPLQQVCTSGGSGNNCGGGPG